MTLTQKLAATIETLNSKIASLEAQVAAASRPASSGRVGKGKRRATGRYWNHPQGSMQFQNDMLDANAIGFLRPDPKGSEVFEVASVDKKGKPTVVKVKCSRYHLSDEELMRVWNAEYDLIPGDPESGWTKPLTLSLVRLVRDLHNLGTHGKYDRKPLKEVPKFVDNVAVAA